MSRIQLPKVLAKMRKIRAISRMIYRVLESRIVLYVRWLMRSVVLRAASAHQSDYECPRTTTLEP